MKTLHQRNKFERFDWIFTLLGEGEIRVTAMSSESENEVGLFHSLVDPLGLAYSFVFFSILSVTGHLLVFLIRRGDVDGD